MATSGSTTVKITSLDSLIFRWERTSFSTADNTSTIKWELVIKASSGGRINSSASKDYEIIVDGKKYSGTNTIGVASGETKVLVSGSQVISHNADGTKTFSYSFTQEIAITFSSSYIGTKSGSGTGTLDLIARKAEITEAPNFNDEANPTIKYSNKAGNAVDALEACISLTGAADDVAYRAISKTGSSYTFNLTAAERKILRQATEGKSRTVRFYVRTTINGIKYLSYISKTLSIVNGNPTVSGTVIDTDAAVVALTGNNNIIVRGYSNANYSITATAKKEASIASYKAVCGDGKSATTQNGTLNNVSSAKFTFTTTDSRGYTSSITINKSFIDYKALTANVKGNLDTDGVLTFTASGNCFNSSFGAVMNVITLEYRIKSNGGDWGEWVDITPSLSNGAESYSVNTTISGLDYRNTYVIQTRATDKLRNITSAEYTVISYPVFDWSESDFNFNVPVSFNAGLSVSNRLLWQGSYYMTEGQTANLSEAVSAQTSGIVLVFSRYDIANSSPMNEHFNYHFVPKIMVELHNDKGSVFNMATSNETYAASKYLYISDTQIRGHTNNGELGTGATGVNYNNNRFVLRYVIGV